jgi:hypothetical protein
MNQALYAHMNNKRKMKKKKIRILTWVKKQDSTIYYLGETHLSDKNKQWIRLSGRKMSSKKMNLQHRQVK